MNLLPSEIVHRILEYDGRIKYRNGKYMNRICKDDERYKMIKTIPKIRTINGRTDGWCILIMNHHVMYVKSSSNYYGENPNIDICTTNTEWVCMYEKEGLCSRIVVNKIPPIYYDGIFYKIYMFFYPYCRMCI